MGRYQADNSVNFLHLKNNGFEEIKKGFHFIDFKWVGYVKYNNTSIQNSSSTVSPPMYLYHLSGYKWSVLLEISISKIYFLKVLYNTKSCDGNG